MKKIKKKLSSGLVTTVIGIINILHCVCTVLIIIIMLPIVLGYLIIDEREHSDER